MMKCYFCNSLLNKSSNDNFEKTKIFFLASCEGCLPAHHTIYRELYDSKTLDLIVDSIRLDEFHIIRNHQTGITTFNKDITVNLSDDPDFKPSKYSKLFHQMNGIWNIPFDSAETLKQKLNLYITFS